MPRYSYVIAFPVLIALCVGINIQRYPAVSAMLRGESVESRWLGRSEVFDFQNTKPSESRSYQGYRSDSDGTSDSRASRVPIPLSGSRSSESTLSGTSSAGTSDRYTSSYGSGTSYEKGSAGSGSTGPSAASTSDRYTSSYGSGASYDKGSAGSGSTGPSAASTSDRYTSSYGSGASYEKGSYGESDKSSTSKKDSYGLYDDKDRDIYDAGDYDAVEDDSSDVEIIPSRISGSVNRNGGMTGSSAGSRDLGNTSDNKSSWPEYSGNGTIGGSFRTDSPVPGYSSRYSISENAPTETASSIAAATPTSSETPATPRTVRPLSLQEKLELRLATPFSLTPTRSENASSGQYIPPDFLPAHENGVVGKLVDPSAEPAIPIKPVTFGSPNAADSSSPNIEATSEKPEAASSTDSSKEKDTSTPGT